MMAPTAPPPGTPMPFEIVCCISSHDSSVYNHVSPLALHPDVTRVWIVRSHRSEYGDVPKTEYVLTRSRWLPLKLLQLLWIMIRLGRRPEVRAFASFNPIPYGSLAALAALFSGKPFHLGFIGSDWQVHMEGPLGRLLMPLVRRAAFITVTGTEMRDAAIARSIDPARCLVLPNSIDLDRYPVTMHDSRHFDFLFVGELIPIKRVDVILHAFANVSLRRRDLRIGIAGRGRLEPELKRLVSDLGIQSQVDFLGFVNSVQPVYARSRIVIIASESEGLPFTLVEGCSSGLVPICTPVGTIPEYIVDGVNGLLTPVGDVDALAGAMISLIEDPILYHRLRDGALKLRDVFSFAAATEVWDIWVKGLRRHAS